MRAFVSSLATLVLCSTALVAHSDDAPKSPADRGQAVLSALPAPSEKGAFKYEFEFLMGGAPVGKGVFAVVPETVDGTTGWRIEETIEMGGGAMSQRTVASLAQDLHLLRYEEAGVENGAETASKAVRTEKGFDITKSGPDGKKELKLEADVHTTGTLSAVLLFLRNCPTEPATYEIHAYSENHDAIENGTIDVKGSAKFTEGATSVDAWTAHAKLGDKILDFFLDPTDRSFLAIRGDQGFVLAKPGLIKKEARKPATSAIEAGSFVALGILTSDEELLSSAIHWPTFYENSKEKAAADGLTDEAAFKASVMQGFRATFKTLDKKQAEAAVAGPVKGATEEAGDGTTFVTFGAPMNAFVYTAKSIDGAWYIVKFEK